MILTYNEILSLRVLLSAWLLLLFITIDYVSTFSVFFAQHPCWVIIPPSIISFIVRAKTSAIMATRLTMSSLAR